MAFSAFHTDKYIFQKSILFSLSFTFLLWLIKALEWSTATDLGVYGILPRTLTGIIGIFAAPLIHGDILHLLSNTFPLLLLLISVFYFYSKVALEVFLWIYIITGFWVWVAAREAYHIGSSGLVYGLASFLFFSGIFRKEARSVAVALGIAFLYGGMLQGLVPTSGSISWESHLLGSAAGILCSFYFRKTEYPQLEDIKDMSDTYPSFHIVNSTYADQVYHTDPHYHYSMAEGKENKCHYIYGESGDEATASEI